MKSIYLSFIFSLMFFQLAGQNTGQLSKLAAQYADAQSANDQEFLVQLAKEPGFDLAVVEYEQYLHSLEVATTTNISKSPSENNSYKGTSGTEKTGCNPIFEDDFESGSHLPTWTEGSGIYSWSADTNDPAEGSYSLRGEGDSNFYGGVRTDFPPSQPEAFSWWVKPTYQNAYHNYIVIGDDNITVNNGILFAYYYINQGGYRFYADQQNNFTVPISLNTWYFIEIKDIDWTNKHFDIYMDHVLIQADFPFRSQGSDHVGRIHLFNWSGGSNAITYYDDIQIGCEAVPFQPFITTWKTDNPGTSCSSCITIPTTGTGYSYDVDWENDGTFDDFGVTGNITHDYGTAGTYTVAIRGDFPRIFFNYTGDRSKILTIEQWGDIQWSSMNSAFSRANNLTENATDAPDLSNVTSMNRMFHRATNLNGDLNNWDVSNVTDMNSLFGETNKFNGNISDWDVSSVTDFSFAFDDAKKFNQDLNNWDVSSATEMQAMFQSATDFNGNISNWDVSIVTNMNNMFNSATAFNQDLSNWDVSNVADMSVMFNLATAFNQDLGNWNIENTTNMASMLSFSGMDVTNYDNTLIGWATQNVKPNISFNADELEYCAGDAARSLLINTHGWNITDDAPLLDGDGDEFCSATSGGSDCNDNDAAINPDAPEICDGKDNDCNGAVDDGPITVYNGNVMFTTQAQMDAWSPCVTTINGHVMIISSNISDLTPLMNVQTITGSLQIFNNPFLTSLDGLDNLTVVGGNLALYYNFSLSDCCAIAPLLTNGGAAGPVMIFYNASSSHCNSVASIMAACPLQPLVGQSPNGSSMNGATVNAQAAAVLELYPNPANNEVNIRFNSIATTSSLRVMDLLGRVVFEKELEVGADRLVIGLNSGIFENGLYLVSLFENGEMKTKQLVVQR